MSEARIKHVIEAVLLASGKPLTLEQLLGVFGDGEKPERDQLRQAITALQEDCAERGVELVEVASGYRMQVKQDMEPWVSRLTEEKPATMTGSLASDSSNFYQGFLCQACLLPLFSVFRLFVNI